MTGFFLGRDETLRNGWRAFLCYLTVRTGYDLLRWALPGLPGWAYPLELFAVLFLTSWLCLALERRPLRDLGLCPGAAWAQDYGKGLLAGVAVIGATAALLYATGGFHLVRTPSGGWRLLLAGALFYLVPALNEELAFRGYIFQRLEQGLGPVTCLGVMSLLFAGAHLGNPGMQGGTATLAFLNIFLAGILLGLAYLGTRSLALPMGLHLGWNWAQGTLLGFGVSGTSARGCFTPVLGNRPTWLTGGAFGLEGSLLCTFICLAACLLFVQNYKLNLLFTTKRK